jgi:hypothetical protein
MRFAAGAVVALLVLAAASTAAAQTERSGYAGGLFEAFVDADRPGHGALIAGVEWASPVRTIGLHLNTETLLLDARGRWPERWAWRTYLKGEAIAANVLADRYVASMLRADLAMRASYLQVGGELSRDVGRHSTLRWEVDARRWWFASLSATDAAFGLPGVRVAGGAGLGWTWWRLRDDAAFGQAARRRERLRGVAVGVHAGVRLRDDATAWGDGAREQAGAQRPQTASMALHQWLRVGTDLSGRLAVQLHQQAAWASAGDDLDRLRLGGQAMPYTIAIAGLPWAMLRSTNVLTSQASVRLRAGGEHEVGVLLDSAVVGEGVRDRASLRGAVGTGVFGDLRWAHWQVDVQLGWAPSLGWMTRRTRLAGLVGFGWSG